MLCAVACAQKEPTFNDVAYNVRDDANILLAIAYTYAALHHSPALLLLRLPSLAQEVHGSS